MSWLTSAWLFWLGFPLYIAAQSALLIYFKRDPESGKTARQEIAKEWHKRGEDMSGLEAIRKHLERLLRQGYDHGFVVLSFEDTDAFLQFRKYIHAKGDCGLELGFPDADWSHEYFPRLPDWCTRNGFACDLAPDSQGGGVDFLHVDTGDDLDAAARLVEGIVTDIFGLEPDARFSYRFDGVSESGEEIDDPTAKPLSPETAVRRRNELYFENVGIYPSDGCLFALFGLFAVVGFFGLEYSLLCRIVWLAAGVEPAWGTAPFDVFGVTLAARTFEIMCVFLVLAGFAFRSTAPAARMRALEARNSSKTRREERCRNRIRYRYVILPLMLTALVLFWLRA